MRTNSTKQKRSTTAEVALTTLAPGAARHLVKAHTGFEQWVDTLATIFASFPDDLGKGGVDIELLRSSVASYQALAKPQAEAAAKHAMLNDSRLVQASQAWDQMLGIYRRAKVAAKKNPAVAKALVDFERWMKNGPQKKRSAVPVVVPPPATA